jgi:hypothetical protein
MLLVQLNKPVQDRSGQTSRLTFRVANSQPLENWFRGVPNGPATQPAQPGQNRTTAPPGQPAPANSALDTKTMDARHDHFITGGCNGKLILTPERLIYESVDDASHSRQWQYSDVREIHRGNPYELEIKPFSGSDYRLKLLGQALDAAVYQTVVDRVVKARVSR